MPLDDRAICTVCIPTYRQAEFLGLAVESVATQTAPVRLIVADDASPDNTADVLASLGRVHRFQAIRHPRNLGISANLQILLRSAETPFIVRLDSDDFLHPEYVEELLALLGRFPQAGYAHCAIQEIDEVGQPCKTRLLGRVQEFQDAETALRRSVFGYQVAANILMFRREALAAVDFGAGAPELNFVEDYDLSIRLAAAGWGNVYSGKVLASYRTWTAPSRPALGRKLREVRGVAYLFTNSLEPAFRQKGWSLKPLRRRRLTLALANAEILDRASFDASERVAMTDALEALAGGSPVGFVLRDSPVSRSIRRAYHWTGESQQMLKRWIKRFVFRR